MIRYVPRRVTRRENAPDVIVRDRNRTGPDTTVTLCGALPVQR